jgi:hypothetical protein
MVRYNVRFVKCGIYGATLALAGVQKQSEAVLLHVRGKHATQLQGHFLSSLSKFLFCRIIFSASD